MNLNFVKKNYIFCIAIFIAAVLYILTAYNSTGYFHADEQYQIIEFAGLKLGTHAPDELAWEYKAKIRPMLQPTLCFVLLKTFKALNITDPYLQAFLLRTISALLAICVITYFIISVRRFIPNKKSQIVFYLLSFFLWFTPLISVRFSSETWSGLFFLLALGIYFNPTKEKIKPYILGCIFGLSFLFRYQIAFAIAGFCLWLIIVERLQFKYILKLFVSFLVITCVGILIDSWFYGEFVFAPWNYFYRNIILKTASSFGTSPWYFYIIQMLKAPTYFIGIPIVLSFIILLIAKPKNFLLWCTLPFIIIHSIIPHKELRFLFPIVYLLPLMLVMSYDVIINLFSRKIFVNIINYLLLIIFIPVNLVGLTANVAKSRRCRKNGDNEIHK